LKRHKYKGEVWAEFWVDSSLSGVLFKKNSC